MSWQLASFLLLALALAGGFAWYERSHPSARVLALVGTLAALAVLGRIAFAPVPNVKPTTDIVLLAGYVFGGAPGFAVGAVAALASNLFFTQGPWTPWQMAAWGAIGVGGAGLAWASRGRLGRIPLALACGAAGLLYGVIVNFGSVVTFAGAGDIWHRYLVYQGTSLPWDLAHAGGNVVFFLIFGSALVQTLRRFRTRLSFTWQPHPAGLAVVLAAALLLAGGAGAATAPAQAATPTQYLLHAQHSDGGFGVTPGGRASGLYTGWAGIALATQHGGGAAVRRAVAWTRAHGAGLTRNSGATGIGDLERTILLLAAAGRSPRAFARQDLVAALTRRVGANGSVLGQVNLTAFAILALRAARVPADAPVLRRAGGWVADQQNGDGGFSFLTKGLGSDVDDTAAAMQALAALGGRGAALRRAAAYIRGLQNPDGGMPQQRGGSSNAQSTAWAIQGLVAARVRLASVHRDGARTPLAYVRSLVGANGAVRYSRTSTQSPVWVTAYAVLAFAKRPLPVTPARGSGR
ncbi:MAG: prenyltransferase/squalene oxidase repeat-containing protein [Conexibacter sp.]